MKERRIDEAKRKSGPQPKGGLVLPAHRGMKTISDEDAGGTLSWVKADLEDLRRLIQAKQDEFLNKD